ncbi:hypothetical protein MNEG_5258 [Monoraphidium neglectum]|jgi:hypothetical protein|uniref:Cx9C motif-containing protein 4, mitochondrial n=1 Tax=Monoraphidium neglectum TaxID=145388 RepID=A0A0D2L794_9CHLO|nr:hypothetical protein MNEG_5258 [Monoraphidium neglectum]KIZ02704.1 hypothetical protein MNEG_5258 [Monoraphidium neglectum]|eukprot:XP_013901723.1 hypothetical protein MNEG_5258 [Monoraphidium neglectum]
MPTALLKTPPPQDVAAIDGVAAAGATPYRNACKSQACAIQDCLNASDYQEARCAAQIAALISCCDAEMAAAPQGAERPIQCCFGPRYRDLAAKHGVAAQQNKK